MKLKSFTINLAIILAVLSASAVWADTLSSGNYTVNDTIPCGGQALTSGSYNVYDLKGQAAAGSLTSGSYTVQLGGIYGLLGGAGAAASIPFTISRNADGSLLLSWKGWAGADPDIYFMIGDGAGKFVNRYNLTASTTTWSRAVPSSAVNSVGFGPISNQSMVVQKNVAPEMYFKALPSGTVVNGVTTPAGGTPFELALTVGKLDVTVGMNGGTKLVGLPFYAGTVSTVFLGQLGANSLTLLPRNGGGLDYVTVTNIAVVGQDFSISPTIGFWMRNPGAQDVKVTFVGSLVTPPQSLQSNLLNLDLTGNPIAVSFPSSALGINDDIILPQNGNGLDYFTRNIANGAATPWGPNFTTVKFGAGFWYKSASNRRWNINTVAPSAVIEQY